MATRLPLTDIGKRKVGKVLSEFKGKTLRSSAGSKVRSQKRALALALSAGRQVEKKRLT